MKTGKNLGDFFESSYEKTLQKFHLKPDEDLFFCIAIDTLIDCWAYGIFLRIWKDISSNRCKSCRDCFDSESLSDTEDDDTQDGMLIIII